MIEHVFVLHRSVERGLSTFTAALLRLLTPGSTIRLYSQQFYLLSCQFMSFTVWYQHSVISRSQFWQFFQTIYSPIFVLVPGLCTHLFIIHQYTSHTPKTRVNTCTLISVIFNLCLRESKHNLACVNKYFLTYKSVVYSESPPTFLISVIFIF